MNIYTYFLLYLLLSLFIASGFCIFIYFFLKGIEYILKIKISFLNSIIIYVISFFLFFSIYRYEIKPRKPTTYYYENHSYSDTLNVDSYAFTDVEELDLLFSEVSQKLAKYRSLTEHLVEGFKSTSSIYLLNEIDEPKNNLLLNLIDQKKNKALYYEKLVHNMSIDLEKGNIDKFSQKIYLLETGVNALIKDYIDLKSLVDNPAKIQKLVSVWGYIDTLFAEPKDYGMYTYVLSNLAFSSNDETSKESIKEFTGKWDALISSIKTYAPDADKVLRSYTNKKHYNLFVIPEDWKKSVSKDTLDQNSLTWGLTRLVMLGISDYLQNKDSLVEKEANLLEQLYMNRGPFLISTLKPISEISSDEETIDILYLDLSAYNENTIPEIVRSYVKTIFKGAYKGTNIEEFYQTRLMLLDFLVEGNFQVSKIKTTLLGIIRE